MLTGSQIRMARGHLNWSTKKLAGEAGVGISTVQRMETVDGVPPSSGKNLEAVQKTLETAGIVFVDANGLGPGVRLRDKE